VLRAGCKRRHSEDWMRYWEKGDCRSGDRIRENDAAYLL
jgi:hypothetical protein